MNAIRLTCIHYPPPSKTQDSYDKDFGLGNFRKAPDFEPDDMVLEKLGKKTVVMA